MEKTTGRDPVLTRQLKLEDIVRSKAAAAESQRVAQSQPELEMAFQRTQGYAVVSHGRRHVFVARVVAATPEMLRRVIRGVRGSITTALELVDSKDAHVKLKEPKRPDVVVAIGFGPSGLKKLKNDDKAPDTAFLEGFPTRMKDLAPEASRHPAADAIVMLASDSRDLLMVEQSKHNPNCEGAIVSWEEGEWKGESYREHFGYRDGLSQPDILATGRDRAPLNLMAVPDAGGIDEGLGSYMALLKIRQDVEAFEGLVRKIAQATSISLEDVKAHFAGRTPEGEPFGLDAKKPEAKGAAADVVKKKPSNEFTFEGSRCPVGAHIRKANPRHEERENHRIFRQGIPYEDKESGEKGMLFQCFQSNLAQGFEFIFRYWLHSYDRPDHGGGRDPFLFERKEPPGIKLDAPIEWPKLTTIQYGEYYYFPSLTVLDGLVAQESKVAPNDPAQSS